MTNTLQQARMKVVSSKVCYEKNKDVVKVPVSTFFHFESVSSICKRTILIVVALLRIYTGFMVSIEIVFNDITLK